MSSNILIIQEVDTFHIYYTRFFLLVNILQSNFNGSNTDGSSTMAYSNSFLSPYGIFPIAQENKYEGNFLVLL